MSFEELEAYMAHAPEAIELFTTPLANKIAEILAKLFG